jgi:hypothetical protein
VSLPPQDEKRFSEAEVAAILRRSAELQVRRITAEASKGAETGVSLAQLQSAAAELGVRPELIAAAAADVAAEGKPSFWGGPGVVAFERLVDVEVTEEEWPELVAAPRRASGRMGVPGQLGKAFEWASPAPEPLHVSVTPTRAGSLVGVSARFTDWAVALYMAAFSGSLVGAIALVAATHQLHAPMPLEVAAAVGWCGAAFAGARTGYTALCRRGRARTQAVLDSVLRHLLEIDARQEPETAVPTRVADEREAGSLRLRQG